MNDDLLAPLLAALPYGVPAGTDLRATVVTTLLDWDEDSSRGLVAIDGGDSVWLVGAADTYWPDAVGNRVIVLRNAWTGKAACILGTLGHFPFPEGEPNLLPARGTVTSTATGRVTVSADGETYTARVAQSYTSPSVGDVVSLNWASDGSEVHAIGRLVSTTISAPSTPPSPALSRSGGTLTVSWSKPSDVDTTRVRWRYAGGAWSTRTGLTGTSTTIGISEGRTREVEIAQSNAGGTSPWSDTNALRYSSSAAPSKPSAPKYETVTTTITPTSTGTYRASRGAWDRWNTSRYGGASTLYQGSDYGSGELTGLATYGSRIKDLRAVEILWIEVRLVDANPGVYSPGNPLRIQVSPHGSRPGGEPSTGAASDTTNLGKGASKWHRLDIGAPALGNFADGSLRGLVLNGSPYRGLRGKGTSGMTIRVRYRRKV